MKPTPAIILSHNLLQSHIGSDHNNLPLIDSSLLAGCNSLIPVTNILQSYLSARNIQPPNNFQTLLAQLPAELRTLLHIADHVAYCSAEFIPADFARVLIDPAAWIGMSHHRLMSFEAPHNVMDIIHASRRVAEQEATELYSSLLYYAKQHEENLKILNEDLLTAHQNDHVV